MDFMTTKEAARKWEVTERMGAVPLQSWTDCWSSEDGGCLADTKRGKQAR